MILTAQRIYLRPLSPADADGDYPNWLNNPEVCRYNSHGEILYTRDMARDYIRLATDNPTLSVFAICLRENDRHIGNISLQNISAKNRSAELAILIGDPAVYGKGIGYEACMLVCEYGFKTLRLHRIYCGTHAENIGMQRVAESLGMRKEGERREAIFKNGKFADIVEYGILSDEFKGSDDDETNDL